MENLHITIEIKAPEIVDAMEVLALAISNQSKLLSTLMLNKASEPSLEPKTAEKSEEASGITEIDLRAKFVELSKKGKRSELKNLLSELGVSKVSDIKPEQYHEAWAKLEAI